MANQSSGPTIDISSTILFSMNVLQVQNEITVLNQILAIPMKRPMPSSEGGLTL